MPTFIRTVPVKINAIQFKYSGTSHQERVVSSGETWDTEDAYDEIFADALSNEIKSVSLKIDKKDSSNIVLSVQIRWYEGYTQERVGEIFELRQNDWLVEDYSQNPIYRVMTNDEFLKLNAIEE